MDRIEYIVERIDGDYAYLRNLTEETERVQR